MKVAAWALRGGLVLGLSILLLSGACSVYDERIFRGNASGGASGLGGVERDPGVGGTGSAGASSGAGGPSWPGAAGNETGGSPVGDAAVEGSGEVVDPPLGTCGDEALSSGEQCEDGNANAGDGCSSDCQLEQGFACEPPAVTSDGARIGGSCRPSSVTVTTLIWQHASLAGASQPDNFIEAPDGKICWSDVDVAGVTAATLQYSSGSTGMAKVTLEGAEISLPAGGFALRSAPVDAGAQMSKLALLLAAGAGRGEVCVAASGAGTVAGVISLWFSGDVCAGDRCSRALAGSYELQNLESRLCVTVQDRSTAEGAGLQQDACGDTGQRFLVEETNVAVYTLKNLNSGHLVTAPPAGAADAICRQAPADPSAWQKWRMLVAGDSFELRPLHDPRLCLDVQYASKSPGAPIQVFACNQSAAQRFRLLPR